MIYEALVLLLPFITSPYVARVIGAEGLGTYSYSYSVAYYFYLFSLLGIRNYGNREIAKTRNDPELLNDTFSNITAIHVLISVLCCLAYIIYIPAANEMRLYAEIQFLFVLSGLFDISWFYFGIEHFKLTVTKNVTVRLLSVICVFVFVKDADDLWKYCLILALGSLAGQLSLWVPLKRYVRIVPPEWKKMKAHLRPLLVLFVPAVAVSLYKYMDKIMLGSLNGTIELGYYENAEKVINLPLTVIASFGTVMIPKMSNLVISKDKYPARRYMSLSMEFVMCFAIALTFGLAGVGTVFAVIFWGEDFLRSGYLIMGLSVTIPFVSYANIVRTQFLIPNALDKEYLISVTAGAVVNLIINCLLIPEYGAMGAMLGTIAAEAAVCMLQSLIVRDRLPTLAFIKTFLPFLPVGIGMFVIVYLLGKYMDISIVTLLVQIIAGGLLYGGFCICYFLRQRNEIVIRILKRGNSHEKA